MTTAYIGNDQEHAGGMTSRIWKEDVLSGVSQNLSISSYLQYIQNVGGLQFVWIF